MAKPVDADEVSRSHWRGAEDAPPTAPAIGYGGFAPRPPGLFAIRRGVVDVATLPEPLRHVFREYDDNLASRFIGLTTDGNVMADLYPLRDTGVSTKPIVEAGRAFVGLLDADEQAKGVLPIESPAWRGWINAFAPRPPHGLLLDEVSAEKRQAALAIFETALSARGFEQLRTTMRINAALGEMAPGYEDTLREFMYWFTIFGEPSEDRPWGFQLYGHHACANAFVVGNQLTVGPMFLGAEPRVIESGTYAGLRAFDTELALGLKVMESLDPVQRQKAVLSKSVKWADLPPELAHPTEGRMRGSVARDNAVIPPEGISAIALEPEQQQLLRDLVAHYIYRLPEGHAALKSAEFDAHFEKTSFAWAGVPDVEEPFYYKVHNPVIFIEVDAHPGIFLSNDDPKPFHIHNIVRIPNGNDYGRAWLHQCSSRGT